MFKKLIVFAAGLAVLIGCTALNKRADVIKAPEIAPGATYVGTETCLECHDDFTSDKHNIHMKIATFEVAGGYKPDVSHVTGQGRLMLTRMETLK